ncbi:DUF6082 family protein [Streptomyces coeruleorubidus]|uniref:DUF6082 family protein n=1 Tax=Streptomyces coeruleorubidus TaxID=116188 RepID=UPI0036777C7C
MGNMNREEFFGFARSMLQNPVFREYWNASRPHRAALASFPEDTDEWWVMGEPPVDNETHQPANG